MKLDALRIKLQEPGEAAPANPPDAFNEAVQSLVARMVESCEQAMKHWDMEDRPSGRILVLNIHDRRPALLTAYGIMEKRGFKCTEEYAEGGGLYVFTRPA